ncbi:MAG: response regulator [Deltaproteobacteria bacterium]|nr:response regulator [Deltaproteobacteria bacterium]
MEEMKIMLVDDEEGFLLTTQKLLLRKGIRVTTATSGAEALEKLMQETIHVVVLDVKMPGMDGVTALKAIKSRFPQVEVIMFTGHASVDSAVSGLMSGATDYLTKPLDIEELVAKVQEAFARGRYPEEKRGGPGRDGSSERG